MKKYRLSDLDLSTIKELWKRPKIDFRRIFGQIESILNDVESGGDEAVQKYNQKFDGVRPELLTINPEDTIPSFPEEVKEAIDLAFDNIYKFHLAQRPNPLEVETMPGVRCMKVFRPVQRVGLYVPGGTAKLPSSAMMLAIPAMIAGCETKVLATPPDEHGNVAPEIMYIARKAGVDLILKAGGAQAIAAMAFGTESVPKVDKLFGPGNQYVTAAKMILQNSEAQVSIDMPAGPSEVLVIADKYANPSYVAADLLSQAEHGADSQVVLVHTPGFDVEALDKALEEQMATLPRAGMAKKALSNSYQVQTNTLDEAFEFSNGYAPEHLILNISNAEDYRDKIMNAGSVFLGALTPESVGDYASGTNHTLPTYGYARMYSGVNLSSFMKSITMQTLNEKGLRSLGPAVEKLAETEELFAHKNAVSIRLKDLNGDT